MKSSLVRRFSLLLMILMAAFVLAGIGSAAAQQDGAVVIPEQNDTETAIDRPADQPLVQTTTLPWAFGETYPAVTALPVAGSGDTGTPGVGSLPLFLGLIGVIASAGGAIAIRTRHAG